MSYSIFGFVCVLFDKYIFAHEFSSNSRKCDLKLVLATFFILFNLLKNFSHSIFCFQYIYICIYIYIYIFFFFSGRIPRSHRLRRSPGYGRGAGRCGPRLRSRGHPNAHRLVVQRRPAGEKHLIFFLEGLYFQENFIWKTSILKTR